MEKGIPLSTMKNKRPILTRTIIRNVFWNTLFITSLYFALNIIFLLILNHEAERIRDNQLTHEIEHLKNALCTECDSLVIENPKEFKETALVRVSPISFFLQVYNQNGEILLQSENLKQLGDLPLYFPEAQTPECFNTIRAGKMSLRVIYGYLKENGTASDVIIQLAMQKANLFRFMPNLIFYDMISFPFVFFLILLGSFVLVRRGFAPINKIIDLANSISATRLNQRLDYKASPTDELGRLRDTLNNLFDRLQMHIEQVSQFTDNASHQLMSPLTVLKSELEYILRKNHEHTDCRDTFTVMYEQTDRMIKIVRTLLILAKEASVIEQERSVLNISKLIQNMNNTIQRKELFIETENGLYVRGDEEYFYMVMQNLINNAFKYSDNGRPVHVTALLENNRVIIKVCDQGHGIPADQKEKIFERFYRFDDGKSDRPSGFGLGLPLVQAIITAMGGTIAIRDNSSGGTCFIISLHALSVK